MKICSKCKIKKSLYEFCKDKSKPDGHRSDCKECYKIHRKKYPWKFILKSIKTRCNKPNSENYKWYGGRGIKCLITEEELKFLWFRDKAYLMNKPSIDRKENDGHYELGNCEFIEMDINLKKSHKDNPRTKTILQFDLNNNFIKEWKSQAEAGPEIGTSACNISDALHQRQNTAKQFIWRYKDV